MEAAATLDFAAIALPLLELDLQGVSLYPPCISKTDPPSFLGHVGR